MDYIFGTAVRVGIDEESKSGTASTSPSLAPAPVHLPQGEGMKLQKVFKKLQKIIAEKGGMIRQLLVDDKGLVLIVVFGVMQVTIYYM